VVEAVPDIRRGDDPDETEDDPPGSRARAERMEVLQINAG